MVPLAVASVMGADLTPSGTTAVTVVELILVMAGDAREPTETCVAFASPVPVMVTTEPAPPPEGEKPLIVGRIRRLVGVMYDPPGDVIDNGPSMAVAGMTA